MLYIWGSGEISRVAEAYFKYFHPPNSPFGPVSALGVKRFVDAKYITAEDQIDFDSYSRTTSKDFFFPSVGYTQVDGAVPNSLRARVLTRALTKFPRETIVSFIHERALVFPDVEMGIGTWIQEHCNIQSGAKVGNGVVCWASSHIGHASVVEDFVWITTGAVICGDAYIKSNAFIGANAVIHPKVTIGIGCVVGSGSIITKDLPDYSVTVEGRNMTIPKKSYEIKL